MTVRSARAAALALFALAMGCGGQEKSAAAPDSAAASDEAESGSSAEAEASSEDGTGSAESAASPKSSCEDGTCAPCGDALCPSGWYCDQTAPGGAACGWLPECAKKPGCACVKKAFSGCACDDSGGIAHLTCG